MDVDERVCRCGKEKPDTLREVAPFVRDLVVLDKGQYECPECRWKRLHSEGKETLLPFGDRSPFGSSHHSPDNTDVRYNGGWTN